MFKRIILTIITLIPFNITFNSTSPEFIKYCSEQCPHKKTAYSDEKTNAMYLSINPQQKMFALYTLYKFEKGNTPIFRFNSYQPAPNCQLQPNNICFVAPTTCKTL